MNNEQPKELIKKLLTVFAENEELKEVKAYQVVMGIMLIKEDSEVNRYLNINAPRTFVRLDEYQEYADSLYKAKLVNYIVT